MSYIRSFHMEIIFVIFTVILVSRIYLLSKNFLFFLILFPYRRDNEKFLTTEWLRRLELQKFPITNISSCTVFEIWRIFIDNMVFDILRIFIFIFSKLLACVFTFNLYISSRFLSQPDHTGLPLCDHDLQCVL